MNALGRLLLGVPRETPARVLPTDSVIRCPDCHSDRAKPSLLILRQWVMRGGKAVGFEDGDRLACQECGCVFSVDSHGVFRQHLAAQPFSPPGPGFAPTAPPDESGRRADEQEEQAPILPIPLRRPNV